MKNQIFLFAMILLLPISFAWAGPNLSSSNSASSQVEWEESGTLKEKVQGMNERQKRRMEKKINFVKNKMADNKLTHKKSGEGAGPVRVALTVILVGALLAILGFAGLGGLLINIGVLVLVIGLIIWLLGLLL